MPTRVYRGERDDKALTRLAFSWKASDLPPAGWVWDVSQEIVQTVYERFEPRAELYTTKSG